MTRFLTPLILFLFLYILPLQAQQSDWKLEKSKDGIEIYTRSVPGSGFKEFRGIAQLEGSLQSVVAVLQDADKFEDWMPSTKRSNLIEAPSSGHKIMYVETSAPFPVSNRDGVYHYTFGDVTDAGSRVEIDVQAVPGHLPEKKGIVRIQHTQGKWVITQTAPDRVQVLYQVHSEPGGSIPSWLANSAVVDIPFETLKRLQERIRMPEYQVR
ncbi:START domain-containing protein [Pontibacter sp. G13]|uniref:START domain-containing protein n=1 Tax=Pontibacter sp. G13 TaxID=3074898 RepID=UPI002888F95B|nr:START domain-containing protein [Pontibacter sp. G13]WNJ21591.1 START domain-containing protein [Pontibacter sp. G13]